LKNSPCQFENPVLKDGSMIPQISRFFDARRGFKFGLNRLRDADFKLQVQENGVVVFQAAI
jgi:hypothetical protein